MPRTAADGVVNLFLPVLAQHGTKGNDGRVSLHQVTRCQALSGFMFASALTYRVGIVMLCIPNNNKAPYYLAFTKHLASNCKPSTGI